MSIKMSKTELFKRYLLFIISLFCTAMGVSLAVKGGLGTSPISSVAYSLSLNTPISLGYLLFIWNMILLGAQIIILRRDFQKIQLMQIPLSLIFGWFTDFSKFIISANSVPDNYVIRLMFTVIGMITVALGVTLSVIANVVLNSGEGFVKAISDKLHLKFGNMKVAFDISCVIMAAVISLLLSHKVQGVREGTFIAAIFTGIIVKLLMKTINKPICRLFNIKNALFN